MTLVLFVAAMAAAIAVLVGGITHLTHLRIRAVRLLVVAAGLQLVAGTAAPEGGALSVGAGAFSIALVMLFMAGNARLAGVPLIAAGLLANVAVIVANGAMPVSAAAAERVGLSESRLQLDSDRLREPADAQTRLAALGDTIPVAVPRYPQVVSPGDVLVAAGVALMLVAGSRAPRSSAKSRTDDPRVDEPRTDGAAQASLRENRRMA